MGKKKFDARTFADGWDVSRAKKAKKDAKKLAKKRAEKAASAE